MLTKQDITKHIALGPLAHTDGNGITTIHGVTAETGGGPACESVTLFSRVSAPEAISWIYDVLDQY